MRPIKPSKKAGIWTLIRFVPKAYQAIDNRTAVRISTGIRVADDPAGIRAYPAVQQLNAQLETYWQALATGNPAAPVGVDQARVIARNLGVAYLPAHELVSKPHEEILRRIDAVTAAGAVDNTKAVAAALGGARKGQIALSALVDEYEALQKLHLSKYSPDQIRKWRNLRERAVNDLQTALGRDVYIEELTRDDALDFRDWWSERIINEGLKIETANKCIGAISAMIEALDSAKRLKLDLVLKNLRLKGGSYEPRAAYPIDFVQDRILADGALDGMNAEARRVVYVCAELGLRPVEVVNLTKNSIRLDAKIPHIIVQPEGRVLKTDHSERHVPLVGVALEAMRLQPEGFAEYFDKSATLSATVNKFMANNGLRPFPKVSLYSLRHTFEDRLTKIEPPEKIQAYLMGHKYDRPKYGSPPELEQLVGWMEKIAFRPPASPI